MRGDGTEEEGSGETGSARGSEGKGGSSSTASGELRRTLDLPPPPLPFVMAAASSTDGQDAAEGAVSRGEDAGEGASSSHCCVLLPT